MGFTDKTDAQLDFAAAEWLIRLEDTERPPTSRQQTQFFEWVRRSPRHLKAFFEAADLWRGLESLDSQHRIDIEKLLARRFTVLSRLRDASEADPSAGPSAGTARTRRFTQPGRWLAAAAVALFACVLPVLAWKWLRDSPVYSTSVSEQRTIRLEDGSVLQLNTRSRARIAFSDGERRIDLLEGEALFSVARDAKRPFLVRTGSATVRAVGTQFNVIERGGTTTVAVVDGRVQLMPGSPASDAPPRATLLAAGETASISRGRVVRREARNVADAVAWRERRLVFRNASLAEVAAEFNRYNTLQFRLADQASATRRLTGIFSADHPQSLILFLERENDLDLRESADEIVIATARGPAPEPPPPAP